MAAIQSLEHTEIIIECFNEPHQPKVTLIDERRRNRKA